MHLASLNVITDAGRSLSVFINADLDILLYEISPTWPAQRFSPPSFCLQTFFILFYFLHFYSVFVTPSAPFLIRLLRARGVPLTPSITVTHCFNVQLHMMRQAHNVLSLLIHWRALSP